MMINFEEFQEILADKVHDNEHKTIVTKRKVTLHNICLYILIS